MPRKSQIRVNAETCLAKLGFVKRPGHGTFVDKSKGGQRVKFSGIFPSDGQLDTLRVEFQQLYTAHSIKVFNVPCSYPGSYGGVAFKVFNK